jgi:hypothetical protein
MAMPHVKGLQRCIHQLETSFYTYLARFKHALPPRVNSFTPNRLITLPIGPINAHIGVRRLTLRSDPCTRLMYYCTRTCRAASGIVSWPKDPWDVFLYAGLIPVADICRARRRHENSKRKAGSQRKDVSGCL